MAAINSSGAIMSAQTTNKKMFATVQQQHTNLFARKTLKKIDSWKYSSLFIALPG